MSTRFGSTRDRGSFSIVIGTLPGVGSSFPNRDPAGKLPLKPAPRGMWPGPCLPGRPMPVGVSRFL
jgi:hypothetical protein